MPKAKEVAMELRKLADGLDKNPEADSVYCMVSFHCNTKEQFTTAARAMTHPITKSVDTCLSHPRLCWQHRGKRGDNDPIWILAYVRQSLTCRLIEPAKEAVYECEPILSREEESSLEVQA